MTPLSAVHGVQSRLDNIICDRPREKGHIRAM